MPKDSYKEVRQFLGNPEWRGVLRLRSAYAHMTQPRLGSDVLRLVLSLECPSEKPSCLRSAWERLSLPFLPRARAVEVK